MASTFYVPLADYIDALWPQNILQPPPADQIGRIWIEPPRVETDPELNVKTALLIEEELALAIPGVDGVSIVLAAAGDDSAFLFEFFTTPTPGMRVLDIPIAVRFAPDLLKPATVTTDGQGNQILSPATGQDHVDITLAKVTLTADFDGSFGVDADAGIDLPPCYIGDTGHRHPGPGNPLRQCRRRATPGQAGGLVGHPHTERGAVASRRTREHCRAPDGD